MIWGRPIWGQRWETIEPEAVRCFKKDFYETLVYYDHKDDKNLISTTNHLERYLEEVRRRIKIQGYFKNEKSLNLWTYGIISQLREEQEPKEPNGMHYYITVIKENEHESVQRALKK
ncbi:MAG: transposase [Candidatus Omnitrophica bacterium]|nr:transposase [Candidatus Omnitrophota bacterium]